MAAFVGLLIVVVAAGLLWFVYARKRAEYLSILRSGLYLDPLPPPPSAVDLSPERPTPALVRRALDRVRAVDPSLSVVALESFLRNLFVEAHRARAGGLERLSPHLSARARAVLGKDAPQGTRDVQVGAIRLESLEHVPGDPRAFVLSVEIDASCREEEGAQRTFLVEHWVLRRGADAARHAAENGPPVGCLRCGAPAAEVIGGVCTRCKEVHGGSDVFVEDVAVRARRRTPPPVTVEEPEGESPTVVDPDAEAKLAALAASDTHVSREALQARVALILRELTAARSQRDASRARPWLTDGQHAREAYWAEVYARQGLRRLRRDAAVDRVELSRVASDAFYDLVTLRVRWAARTSTVDDGGRVVSGDPGPRTTSEYWTLLRRKQRVGAVRADLVCPSCGGPLETGEDGDCTACRARLPTGEFDWVVDRIDKEA